MPWLHAVLPVVSRAAAAVYYRIRYAGEPVPASGPVLLVANHPNSLLDPMLVAAAARRRVRFLAKAPLFDDVKVSWLVKGAAAIPVYRRSDDPTRMDQNADAFRAVYAALAQGAAVGIFPEGLSHSEPALAPLKTGAARVALGAAALGAGALPVVPVGLTFRQKDVFRSEALVVTGAAVAWADLAGRGADDAGAVRELTARIDAALKRVTVNLERWQDQPLVECAVAVWEAGRGVTGDHAGRLERLALTTRMLAEARQGDDAAALALADDLERHRGRLERLRLTPHDLSLGTGAATAVTWAVRRAHLLLPLAALAAVAGFAVFVVPWWLTGALVRRVRLKPDERSTWKLLAGLGVYGLWLVAVMAVLGIAFGWRAALPGVVLLPLLGTVGLAVRERWRGAWDDARRFFLLRSRRDLVAALRAEQAALEARLEQLVNRHATLEAR